MMTANGRSSLVDDLSKMLAAQFLIPPWIRSDWLHCPELLEIAG